jgi:hypothetical protein
MKLAHHVEINDPLNPLPNTLSRSQIWRGLVLRAEQPQLFIPWLDDCVITSRSETTLSRSSHFGEVVVRDEVVLTPQEKVVYRVPAQKEIPASLLTMRIEEPEPGVLFVRFEYDHDEEQDARAAADNAEAMYDDFRRSAYEEADIDTIRMIRQLAKAGKLGE